MAPILLSACLNNGAGCGQKITTNSVSPDSQKTVVWVVTDCGATTAPIGTTYLISSQEFETLDPQNISMDSKYEVFSSERGRVEIVWKSENALEVQYDFTPVAGRTGQFIFQNDKVENVRVTYKNVAK